MKIKILLFVLLVSTAIFPQILDGPYFNGLTGMEDKNGNTHLFYRIYDYADSNDYNFETHNNIWHYDVSKNIDTLFQYDLAYQEAVYTYYSRTNDIKFWDSDPAKYILCGGGGTIDGRGFIKRFDMKNALGMNSFLSVEKIFISGKNDSLLLASCAPWFISKDGGWKWDTLKSYKSMDALVGVQPQKDSVIFFIRNNYLWKSSDLGFHASVVDSSFTPIRNEPVFDADMKHVYFQGINKAGLNALYVSDNEGEPESWKECWHSTYSLQFSVDKSYQGNVYIADGTELILLRDFGKNHTTYKFNPKNFVGLYKKPNSEKLYFAMRYGLFEFEKDSITEIKTLPVPKHLMDLYPLTVGNKWVYDVKYTDNSLITHYGFNVSEVIGDTVMSNGKKYFCISGTTNSPQNSFNYTFERIDSATGLVYRYLSNFEYLIEDLAATQGDIVYPIKSVYSSFNEFKCSPFNITKWNIRTSGLKFSALHGGAEYSLIKYFGLADYVSYIDLPLYSVELKGCRINGIIYGDTAVTAVKSGSNALPTDYSLFQNYPNPFNPVTVIKYALPREARVLLTIYNTLGQKIKELVNEIRPAGLHEVSFDGNGFPSGIYFYRIQAGKFSETKKLILLK